MMTRALIVAAAFLAAAPALAADLISKTSPHSVASTIDRLVAAAETAGATVFARIDHAKGAEDVGLTLSPAQVLIFGNPKLGTPAMQDAATAGLDLPLRVLAYADGEGVVHVTYHDPAVLAQTHGLPTDAAYLNMMASALNNLTDQAIAD